MLWWAWSGGSKSIYQSSLKLFAVESFSILQYVTILYFTCYVYTCIPIILPQAAISAMYVQCSQVFIVPYKHVVAQSCTDELCVVWDLYSAQLNAGSPQKCQEILFRISWK